MSGITNSVGTDTRPQPCQLNFQVPGTSEGKTQARMEWGVGQIKVDLFYFSKTLPFYVGGKITSTIPF